MNFSFENIQLIWKRSRKYVSRNSADKNLASWKWNYIS